MTKEMTMTEYTKIFHKNRLPVENAAGGKKRLYIISAAAGAAAGGVLLTQAAGLLLAVLSPGVRTGWVPPIQDNWLMVIFKLHAGFEGVHPDLLYGRNLVDLAVLALVAVTVLGLYTALRETSKIASLIALVQPFLGIVLFTATALAGRCALMGAVLVISGVMLRTQLFGKSTAAMGLLSGVLLLAGDFGVGVAPSNALAVLTGIGYGLLVTWLFLAARRLFQLGLGESGGAK